MNDKQNLEILSEVGAVITDSHVVYTSGRHGSAYINKDAIYPHTKKISRLCLAFAREFAKSSIDVVIAPAVGGVILSQWTAYHLTDLTGIDVAAVYAEKCDTGERFVIKRGYDKFIPEANVLVVEDVLTTGGSAKKVVEAVRALGGKVQGLAVLCNRGGVTPQDVADPPALFALINLRMDSWDESQCPLCKQKMPINLDVGKGREFLERQKKAL